MKLLSILAITFLYLEIFLQQISGLNIVQYDCGGSSSYCYTISDEKANWDTANATCVQQGGELINYVYTQINNIVQAHDGGEYYWTGYRRVGNTSVFQSTDGRTFSDCYDWKDKNPKAGIDCVGFDGKREEFLSLECNTNNNVFCNIDYKECGGQNEAHQDVCSSPAFSYGIPTENTLRDLSLNFNLTTGDTIEFYDSIRELIVTGVKANTETQVQIATSTIQIGADTLKEDTTLVIHKTEDRGQFSNTASILVGDIITIYTSSNYTGNATITFELISNFNFVLGDTCVNLTPDGNASPVGLDTDIDISNKTIRCSTKLQRINTIGIRGSSEQRSLDIVIHSLSVIRFFISIISVLFLFSSLVIFCQSGKKFFSHDINILHSNNTLSLFLAIIISLLPIFPRNADNVLAYCFVVSFILLFLWINVFLSSLSIAIVVFYSIWIVSIKHTARKLYKYLIPIGWGVSLVWALAWVLHDSLDKVRATSCGVIYSCIFSNQGTKVDISWPFLGLMIVILLINATLLILSLGKIWSVLKKQNSQQGELKRLRRVAIGGILLIPSLGLPFISLIAAAFSSASNDEPVSDEYEIRFLIILLMNSPIGIMHFIFITCQIRETKLCKCCFCFGCCCCCYRRMTPAQTAHSLHLNIARKSSKPKLETSNDVILDH